MYPISAHLNLILVINSKKLSNVIKMLDITWISFLVVNPITVYSSLGPVVYILAIFSNANILKNKRIKIYQIKGIGCPLLISMSFLTKERENDKEEKMIRLEPRLGL